MLALGQNDALIIFPVSGSIFKPRFLSKNQKTWDRQSTNI